MEPEEVRLWVTVGSVIVFGVPFVLGTFASNERWSVLIPVLIMGALGLAAAVLVDVQTGSMEEASSRQSSFRKDVVEIWLMKAVAVAVVVVVAAGMGRLGLGARRLVWRS